MQNGQLFSELLDHPNNKSYKPTALMGLQALNKKQLDDAKSISMDFFDLINSPFGNKLTQDHSDLIFFDSVSKSKSFVYCGINANRLGKSAQLMGRVILADIKTLVSKIEREVPKEKQQPIFVIVDEFANFLNHEFLKVI